MHASSNHVWEWNMVPQQNTTAQNGHNTMQNGTNNDGTNTAWQNKCKLYLLKDRCHWCYPPNFHQQALMGRACLTAERQQVDQTVWQSGTHETTSGLEIIQKRYCQDDLEQAIGPNWSHVAKDWHCWTISREGFLPQEWSKNPDDDDTCTCRKILQIWKVNKLLSYLVVEYNKVLSKVKWLVAKMHSSGSWALNIKDEHPLWCPGKTGQSCNILCLLFSWFHKGILLFCNEDHWTLGFH